MRVRAPRLSIDEQRGSVIVEFLMVMPAFLVMSMFVLEVGLMWADRHVARLAAFEAARIYSSANLPEWVGTTRYDEPCGAPNVDRRARQAALRKMAIIAPPLPLYVAKLGKAAQGINFGVVGGSMTGALARMAKRWPTAVASTQLSCTFDPYLKQVNVTLTYDRMLQTPIIDRVMFLTYQLSRLNRHTPTKFSLDENFMAIRADQLSPLALEQARKGLSDALPHIQSMNLSLSDAANFLRAVPGIDKLFSGIPTAPSDITAALGGSLGNVVTDLSKVNGIQSTLDQQAALLTSLVAMVPEALWRIPLTVDVAMQREAYSKTAKAGPQSIGEEPWQGLIRGVLDLSDGNFRDWAFKMNEPGSHAAALTHGAAPVTKQ